MSFARVYHNHNHDETQFKKLTKKSFFVVPRNGDLFRYNVETNNFDKDTLFASYLDNDKYLSGKLVYNKDENQHRDK